MSLAPSSMYPAACEHWPTQPPSSRGLHRISDRRWLSTRRLTWIASRRSPPPRAGRGNNLRRLAAEVTSAPRPSTSQRDSDAALSVQSGRPAPVDIAQIGRSPDAVRESVNEAAVVVDPIVRGGVNRLISQN